MLGEGPAEIVAAVVLGDEIEIDCLAKTIKRSIVGSFNDGVVGEHMGQVATFSDEEDWIRLDPDSNTFTYTDSDGMGSGRVTVTIKDKDTWA